MKWKILVGLCIVIGCLSMVNGTAFGEATKPSCTVLLFHPDAASTNEAESQQITDQFVQLLNQTDLYFVIDYKDIKKNISSQKIWRLTESCAEKECAVEVGKILNSDYVIYGVLGNVGNLRSLETALIDVKDGEVVNQVETTYEGTWDVFAQKAPEVNLRSLLGVTISPQPESQPEPQATESESTHVKQVIGDTEDVSSEPEKQFTIGPRLGVAASDDGVEFGAGIEARFVNLSFKLFGNLDGLGTGLGYYLHPVGNSPFLSAVFTYYDKENHGVDEIGRIYGLVAGYRINFTPQMDACIGIGAGYVNWDQTEPPHDSDEEIVPLGEITIGYMF